MSLHMFCLFWPENCAPSVDIVGFLLFLHVTTQVGLPYSYYDETISAYRSIITSHLTLMTEVVRPS